MIGWVRTPSPAEKPYLQETVRELPEYGRLTGRGGTANLENVLKFKPDLIIDVGSVSATYVSLANNVQEQTKIPYVLLDGAFGKTPEIYRLLGELLGIKDRAEQLANYADETLNGLSARIASIPQAARPKVYYGRGVNGLETGLATSINLEVLERVGAINVAARGWHGRSYQGVHRAGVVMEPGRDPGTRSHFLPVRCKRSALEHREGRA